MRYALEGPRERISRRQRKTQQLNHRRELFGDLRCPNSRLQAKSVVDPPHRCNTTRHHTYKADGKSAHRTGNAHHHAEQPANCAT
jgi:hypothetical protein